MAGYHLKEPTRGVYGELSKIYEEVEELRDANEQSAKLMVLQELSDILGAVDGYLRKHYPNISIYDLWTMTKITKRAFESGQRTPKE